MKQKKAKIEEISLYNFFQMFPNEEVVRKYFEEKRWNSKPICPHCTSNNVNEITSHKMSHWCRNCRKHFSVRVGTILETSKLSLHKWLLCIYLLGMNKKGISSVQISKVLGITQKSSWFLCHRIRQIWSNKSNESMLFAKVEVDETYIGGKESKKKKSKKLNKGRGPIGKFIVIGVKQREGNVIVKHIQNTSKLSLHSFINETVKKGSTVYTDTFKAYKGLIGYEHLTINHSIGDYVDGQIYTNGIESFWAILKRGYYGIYHYMSEKHLHRYINEFAFRYNDSKEGVLKLIESTLKKVCGIRLSYRNLIKIS